MAGAAPAYRYSYPQRAPERQPSVRVVPGRGRQTTNTLPPTILLLAKVFAVMLVVFAVLSCVRIGLASASVTAALSTDELSTQIESARSEGNNLQVRQSYLSNASNLKTEAAKLKMVAPEAATALVLTPDVVTTDEEGNLSLALSLNAAARS